MFMILVPGFWLAASSWEACLPPLEKAGHQVLPLTLPGLESPEVDRTGIGLADHVAAVVTAVDATDGDVVLVGHSGGGPVVHGAVDQRPHRVAHAVYVDCFPLPPGVPINPALPVEGGEIPLPSWDFFRQDGARNLDDLTDEQLAQLRGAAIATPAAVARDPQALGDEARFAVPVTVVATTFSRAEIDDAIAAGAPQVSELARVQDLTVVELPTGHWPQLTQPRRLGELIRDAVAPRRPGCRSGPTDRTMGAA